MPKERLEKSKDVPPEGPGQPLKLLQPRKQATDAGRDRAPSGGIEVLEIVTTVQENLIQTDEEGGFSAEGRGTAEWCGTARIDLHGTSMLRPDRLNEELWESK